MARFGDLINSSTPVLIDFYLDEEAQENTLHRTLRDVAAALGDKAKVIKVDITKNEALTNALKVRGNPTHIIYKAGEMRWRQSGNQDANTLIGLIQKFL